LHDTESNHSHGARAHVPLTKTHAPSAKQPSSVVSMHRRGPHCPSLLYHSQFASLLQSVRAPWA